jgi:CheY-like chemotaxis protein
LRLGEAVRAVAALSEMSAREKGVNLVVQIAPEAEAPVLGDELRVKQIVGNLLSNAVKFTDQGEVSVTVDVRPGEGARVFRIDVKDTGVGFDGAQRDRIFGRFQQADGSITRRFGGSGLGLSITRQLTELMGGELDCESVPGRGSTFTVRLPLEAAPEASAVAEEIDEADAHGLRVLLADDHAVNRKVVELILDATGAALTSVDDGQAALDAFREGGFDVVLMDMQMPVMDGLTAVQEIRAYEARPGASSRTPILMLTANALPEHRTAAAQAGADGLVAKPITSAALLAAIAEAVQGRAEADQLRHAAG